jgi:hypothetical protein
MTLALSVESEISKALEAAGEPLAGQYKGTALVVPGLAGEGPGWRFLRLDDGSPLPEGVARLVYRRRDNRVQVGPGSFFFQEGQSRNYARARFAELRVDEAGNCLLTHLLDAEGKRIQPATGGEAEAP